MLGAESLVHTLLQSGVATCFANPGTSEMHFVAALDRIEGMRCVLGLQENVVTGMADGYFRIAGRPACTLLHCGPGLANGMANLHNARRAHSGIVNVVGDQATFHRPFDAPLTADTEGMARTVSHWVRTSVAAPRVGADAAAAIEVASGGRIATLILPSDASWTDGGEIARAAPAPAPRADNLAIENAARALRDNGAATLILIGGSATSAEAQLLAEGIAQATGAALLAEYPIGRIARGAGRPSVERVPYDGAGAIKALEPYATILLVNARAPVGFFAYPGQPSRHYREDADVQTLSRDDQDPVATLTALAQLLDVPAVTVPAQPRPEVPLGEPVSPAALGQTLAALMPEGSIVSDESISYGRGLYAATAGAPVHDWLHLAGGAIGDGLPVATGAAIAGGGRRVISIQADGSAMYSLQALWTQAREKLPCTTILLNNGKYNILIGEYARVGATAGRTAMDMLELDNPALDWVKLAEGMGVEAARATDVASLGRLLERSFSIEGPFLIELMI